MNTRAFLILATFTVLFPHAAFSQQLTKRPEWDQEKAVAKVQAVLNLEKQGQPWDRVPWMTDVDQAIARASKESKPIFVYFFLKKNVGPAAAPC